MNNKKWLYVLVGLIIVLLAAAWFANTREVVAPQEDTSYISDGTKEVDKSKYNIVKCFEGDTEIECKG